MNNCHCLFGGLETDLTLIRPGNLNQPHSGPDPDRRAVGATRSWPVADSESRTPWTDTPWYLRLSVMQLSNFGLGSSHFNACCGRRRPPSRRGGPGRQVGPGCRRGNGGVTVPSLESGAAAQGGLPTEMEADPEAWKVLGPGPRPGRRPPPPRPRAARQPESVPTESESPGGPQSWLRARRDPQAASPRESVNTETPRPPRLACRRIMMP